MGARGDAFRAVRSPSAADLIAASKRSKRSATPIDGSQPSLAILLGAPIGLRPVGRVPPPVQNYFSQRSTFRRGNRPISRTSVCQPIFRGADLPSERRVGRRSGDAWRKNRCCANARLMAPQFRVRPLVAIARASSGGLDSSGGLVGAFFG